MKNKGQISPSLLATLVLDTGANVHPLLKETCILSFFLKVTNG